MKTANCISPFHSLVKFDLDVQEIDDKLVCVVEHCVAMELSSGCTSLSVILDVPHFCQWSHSQQAPQGRHEPAGDSEMYGRCSCVTSYVMQVSDVATGPPNPPSQRPKVHQSSRPSRMPSPSKIRVTRSWWKCPRLCNRQPITVFEDLCRDNA